MHDQLKTKDLLSSVKFKHDGCFLSNQRVDDLVCEDAKALRFFFGVAAAGVEGTEDVPRKKNFRNLNEKRKKEECSYRYNCHTRPHDD